MVSVVLQGVPPQQCHHSSATTAVAVTPLLGIALGSGGVSIPTLVCCLYFDNCSKPSLSTGTNMDGPSTMVPSSPAQGEQPQ